VCRRSQNPRTSQQGLRRPAAQPRPCSPCTPLRSSSEQQAQSGAPARASVRCGGGHCRSALPCQRAPAHGWAAAHARRRVGASSGRRASALLSAGRVRTYCRAPASGTAPPGGVRAERPRAPDSRGGPWRWRPCRRAARRCRRRRRSPAAAATSTRCPSRRSSQS